MKSGQLEGHSDQWACHTDEPQDCQTLILSYSTPSLEEQVVLCFLIEEDGLTSWGKNVCTFLPSFSSCNLVLRV